LNEQRILHLLLITDHTTAETNGDNVKIIRTLNGAKKTESEEDSQNSGTAKSARSKKLKLLLAPLITQFSPTQA
jgi:hypothetical protein